MNEFQLMMAAGEQLPEQIKLWTTWMQIVLFALPVLFIKYKPVRWLLLAQVGNIIIAYSVFVAEGFNVTRLFGVGHILWVIPLWVLAKDVISEKALLYRVFACVAVATMCISLVFDVRDIALWMLGDRESVLVH